MFNDSYIWERLFIPLIMIFVLGLMVFFHRRQVFKYLYIVNIFLYLVAIITFFYFRESSSRPTISLPLDDSYSVCLGHIYLSCFWIIVRVS